MGHSKNAKAESRERILAAASRQIRDKGLEGVSIGDLMRSAGLTHGGFYGHFASRDALLAAALDRALDDGIRSSRASLRDSARPTFEALVRSYLSPVHRDSIADGCAIAALAMDVARSDADVGDVMRDHLRALFAETADLLDGDEGKRSRAVAAWCTMIGGLALARLFDEPAEATAVLHAARTAILHPRDH